MHVAAPALLTRIHPFGPLASLATLIAVCCSCASAASDSTGAKASSTCNAEDSGCTGAAAGETVGSADDPSGGPSAANDGGPGPLPVPPPPATPVTATFYVAPNGADGNDGSIGSPWRTISHANARLTAGQMVLVRAGTYGEDIQPANSGTSTARIYYRAYPGETVSLTGSSAALPVVNIGGGKDYVTVDGFHVFQGTPTYPGYSGHYNHVVLYGQETQILNCKIVNPRDELQEYYNGTKNESAIAIASSGNLIQGNEIRKVVWGIHLGGFKNVIRGNTIESVLKDGVVFGTSYGQIQGNLIESNVIGGSHFSDGIQSNGNFALPDMSGDASACGVVIRHNVIHDNAENGIDIKGSCRIVIEGNVLYGSRGDNDGTYRFGTPQPDVYGGSAIQIGTGTYSSDVIIRNNVVYDNYSGVAMKWNWMIYNNTIVGNNRDFTGPNSGSSGWGGVYDTGAGGGGGKNNIIGDHINAEIINISIPDWDYNIYYNSSRTPHFGWRKQTPMEFPQWLGQIAGDRKSRIIDPMLANVPSGFTKDTPLLNFRLAAGSPAADAGTSLTQTRSAGTGQQVPVRNAYYFHDGHTIVSGDRIKVGGNDIVTITSIDYESHRLTVDKSITWNADDPVNLPYKGAAPDIGAYEQ